MRRWAANQEVSFSCLPYGTGQAGQGVCLLLKVGDYRILLDCGLEDLSDLKQNQVVDLVLCSHAHGDHARGLLSFHQSYPQVPIYTSEITAHLLPLLWPGQTINDLSQELPWRLPFKVLDDLTVELFPAGHIPGAAAFLLTYQTKGRSYKIFYTGDFCLSNFQLVDGLSVEPLRGLNPDILILEGTYGTNRHPHRRQQEKTLMHLINSTISRGQSIAFFVNTLGIGQEILKLLRSHHQFTGRELDIWVGGEQLSRACDLYIEMLPQFPLAVQNFAKHQPLFWDERVFPKMRRITPDNQPKNYPYILLSDDPSIILKYCDKSWLILLSEQQKNIADLFADLHCESYLLAEHSDGRNTTQLIHNLRPQHVVLIHGPSNYLRDIAALEELQNRYQLHVPSKLHQVELPIGEKFIQPTLVPTVSVYEGELNEVGSSIIISLPSLISNDTRWPFFAGTGIVEARWQGEELVIRGLQEKELLLFNSENKSIEDLDCCSNCSHYRGQKCWNTKSPLYDFKVTPEGCCPVFEAVS